MKLNFIFGLCILSCVYSGRSQPPKIIDVDSGITNIERQIFRVKGTTDDFMCDVEGIGTLYFKEVFNQNSYCPLMIVDLGQEYALCSISNIKNYRPSIECQNYVGCKILQILKQPYYLFSIYANRIKIDDHEVSCISAYSDVDIIDGQPIFPKSQPMGLIVDFNNIHWSAMRRPDNLPSNSTSITMHHLSSISPCELMQILENSANPESDELVCRLIIDQNQKIKYLSVKDIMFGKLRTTCSSCNRPFNKEDPHQICIDLALLTTNKQETFIN